MSYPERLLTDDETIIRQFRPHWRLLFMPVVWAILGIAAIILLYVLFDLDSAISAAIVGVILIALIPLTIVRFVQWWFTTYVLTSERLITRKGVIAKSGIEIPLDNITNVVFSQNVIERLLGSGDLLIESAGESGQSRFSDIPDPEDFQSLLYRVREQHDSADKSTPAPAAAPAGDATERLRQLTKLHADGMITDEEFERKRQEVLDQI